MDSQFHFKYEPREAFVGFHSRDQQFGAMVCHRRAGKTVSCIGELIVRAMRTQKKNARFAYIGPFRQQAKETAWQYLKDYTEGFTLGQPRESELRVRLPNNATITVYGADNVDAFRGLYFDGIVVDEYGDCRATLWNEVLLPALLDRNGWAVFIGTPKGKNHFYKMVERARESDNWFDMTLRASESGILSGTAMELARAEMTDEAWQQEMECDFNAAVPGTYYAKIIGDMELNGSIGSYGYTEGLPVFAAGDLGYSDSTAWWFWQVLPTGPRFINYMEDSSRPLQHYFDYFNSLPYRLDTIYLPHDAKAKSLQTGRSTIEQFLEKGYPVRMAPKLSVQHGIDAARKILPMCEIDAGGCYGGIEALRAYRRRFNDKTQQYDDKPLHDWSSNGSDAFRYASLVTDTASVTKEATPAPAYKLPEYTLDDLWKEREDDEWRSSIIRL